MGLIKLFLFCLLFVFTKHMATYVRAVGSPPNRDGKSVVETLHNLGLSLVGFNP
jgi:hypothetical protein